jgi:hypothetical protein
MRDQIGDPQTSPGPEQAVELGKGLLPVGVIPQMMQHGGGENHIVALLRQIGGAEIRYDSLHGSRIHLGDPLWFIVKTR